LSTVGSKTSEHGTARANGVESLPPVRIPPLLRYIDMVVLALALPVFLLAGFPIAGYLVGGGAWIVQRVIQVVLQRRAAASEDPRTVVGIAAASMIARGWFCAIAIFLVGILDSNDAGLAAALLVIALFTVYFTVQMILRPFDQAAAREARAR
jgi:hypothetical protein